MSKISILLVAVAAVAVQASPVPYDLSAISNAALNHNWNEVSRIVHNDVGRRFNFVQPNQNQPQVADNRYVNQPQTANYQNQAQPIQAPGTINEPGVYVSTGGNGGAVYSSASSSSNNGHTYGIRTNIVKTVSYENGRPVEHSYGHEDIYNDGKVKSYDFTPQ